MRVRFDNAELERIESETAYHGRYDVARVRAFHRVMAILRSARNEQDLRALRGLNFESLKGNRSHQHSLRLNKQWRLIVEIERQPGADANILIIKTIEDYH